MSVFVEEKSGGKNACSRRGMLTVNWSEKVNRKIFATQAAWWDIYI